MLKHSAEIKHDLLSDFLEVVLTDSIVKEPRRLVLRFPISSRTGVLDINVFTCAKSKDLSIQYICRELFWVYNFILEFSDWKEHLAEYDDFCSNRL